VNCKVVSYTLIKMTREEQLTIDNLGQSASAAAPLDIQSLALIRHSIVGYISIICVGG